MDESNVKIHSEIDFTVGQLCSFSLSDVLKVWDFAGQLKYLMTHQVNVMLHLWS